MYQKELTRKYKKSPNNSCNWNYLEETDQFMKPDGVIYSFKSYARRCDKYGFKRDFKIYEADKNTRHTRVGGTYQNRRWQSETHLLQSNLELLLSLIHI